MGVASKIIFYVLPIVFLLVVLVIFFGESGAWEELKATILDLKRFLPEMGMGAEELGAEISIPEIHQAQILSLSKTIFTMLGKGKENCFANYGGFSELGKEEGTSILINSEGNKTVLTVGGGAGGKQMLTELRTEFPGMKPCVIAGRGRVAEHFFNFFIEEEKQLVYPYFQPVDALTIYYQSKSGKRKGNSIAFLDIGLGDNFEDGGWLFTPDGEHICFFPTNWVFNYGESGIANEWFTDGEVNSIPNLIKQGKLKLCS